MLPEIWQPNMQVNIKWEVDPNPFPTDLPEYSDPNYRDYMKKTRSQLPTISDHRDYPGIYGFLWIASPLLTVPTSESHRDVSWH